MSGTAIENRAPKLPRGGISQSKWKRYCREVKKLRDAGLQYEEIKRFSQIPDWVVVLIKDETIREGRRKAKATRRLKEAYRKRTR